jgi:hypothetical protein
MGLRPQRRNLVVWSQSVGPAGRRSNLRFTRPTRIGRIRAWMRIGALVAIVRLLPVARAVLARWRPLLAGTALIVAGVIMRGGPGSILLLPGLMTFMSAPLMPGRSGANSMRFSRLERELAAYSTPAQRRELEATLDRYPDRITYPLREILASQATAAYDNRFPAIGRD